MISITQAAEGYRDAAWLRSPPMSKLISLE